MARKSNEAGSVGSVTDTDAGIIASDDVEHVADGGIIGEGDGIIEPSEFASDGSEQAKRGRGRPRKSGLGDSGSTKRSSTATSGGGQKKKVDLASIDTLNSLLYSVHLGVATMLKTPELVLSQEESEKLAKAAANVSRHYDILPSQKAMDWGALFIAMGVIYAPRAIAYSHRMQSQNAVAINEGFAHAA